MKKVINYGDDLGNENQNFCNFLQDNENDGNAKGNNNPKLYQESNDIFMQVTKKE